MVFQFAGSAIRGVLASFGEFVTGRQIARGVTGKILERTVGKIFPSLAAKETKQLISVAQTGIDAGRVISAISPDDLLPMSSVPENPLLGMEFDESLTSRAEIEVWVEPLGKNIRIYVDEIEGMTLRELYQQGEEIAVRNIGLSPSAHGLSDSVQAEAVSASSVTMAFRKY